MGGKLNLDMMSGHAAWRSPNQLRRITGCGISALSQTEDSHVRSTMSPTQPEALSNVVVTGKTNQAVLGFPHEEVRRANQLHRVFTPRDEIELCVEYHE